MASINTIKVLDFLESNGAGAKFTAKQVQQALGVEKVQQITGAVLTIERKGKKAGVDYIERFSMPTEIQNPDGTTTVKDVKYFTLTEAGMNLTIE